MSGAEFIKKKKKLVRDTGQCSVSAGQLRTGTQTDLLN